MEFHLYSKPQLSKTKAIALNILQGYIEILYVSNELSKKYYLP